MIVDLSYLQGVLKYRKMVNDEPLDKITWIKNGKEVVIDKASLDEWKFIGLNNVTFAEEYLLED